MLRLRKRHCFRFGFVGYAAVPEDVPASVRSAQAPGGTAMVRTVFHFGISGAGNDVDGERRRFVHAIPTRKPAGANPHVVAGLLTCPVRNAFPAFDGQWQRVLRASPFRSGDSQQRVLFRIRTGFPIVPSGGREPRRCKDSFFSFRWSFLHAKRQKSPGSVRSVVRGRSGAGPGQVRRRYFFWAVGAKVLEKVRVGISSRKTAAFTVYSLSSAIGAVYTGLSAVGSLPSSV